MPCVSRTRNNHAKACTPSADAATSATSTTAIRKVRFTSIRDVAQTSQMRKYRSIGDGCRTGQFDPFAAV
jgi:hypothetical protein